MNTTDEYKKIRVLSTRGLSPTVRGIRFEFVEPSDCKDFVFSPGSFIMLSVPGFGESPYTFTTTPSELPEFEVAIRTVGNNTMALNRLKPGDVIYFRGPLGNPIDFKGIYGRELLVIAGGIGLAPLRSLIRHISENPYTVSKLTIVYGTKTPQEIIYKEEFAKWSKFAEIHLTVDKADEHWEGEIGNVVEVLKKLKLSKDARSIVCGPPAMLEPIAKELMRQKLSNDNIYFMLERRIKCGNGKCQHCTCGDKYVCLDGPTFTFTEIKNNWEALK